MLAPVCSEEARIEIGGEPLRFPRIPCKGALQGVGNVSPFGGGPLIFRRSFRKQPPFLPYIDVKKHSTNGGENP